MSTLLYLSGGAGLQLVVVGLDRLVQDVMFRDLLLYIVQVGTVRPRV